MSVHWLDHVGLVAEDLEETVRFYEALLHTEPVERVTWRGSDARYVADMLGVGPELELDAAFLHVPGTNTLMELLQFRNVDQDRVAAQPTTAGRTHLAIPVQEAHSAWTNDPNGIAVELVHRPNRASSLDHIGIAVSDLEASVAFYRVVLEVDPLDEEPSSGRHVARFQLPDTPALLELTQADGSTPAMAAARTIDVGATHIGLFVEDLDLELGRLELPTAGDPVTVPYGPYKGGRSAYLRDPDGSYVQLMELAGRPGNVAIPGR